MKFIRFSLLFFALVFFAAIATNAQAVWQKNLDGKVAFYQTTDFGVMIAGTDDSLYAFDGQTGETLWRKKTRGLDETSVTPIPATDLILISNDLGDKSRVEAVDLLSGGTVWQSDKVKGDVLQLAVAPEQNLLAVVLVKKTTGKVGEEFKRHPIVHVFNLANGDELWKKELESDVQMMPSRFDSDNEVAYTLDNYRAPLILDGRLFLFYEGVTSYDAQTGKEGEREKFSVNEDNLALTEADPVFDDKFLYTSGHGKIRAINRGNGKVEWEAKDLGVTPEMAIVSGVLYVRTGGQFTSIKDGETKEKGAFGVSALDTRNGKTLWRFKGADKGLTNFVFADANTILIADKNDLITIDAANGKRISKIKHDIERAQFVLINESGAAVVGGRDEIAAFSIAEREMRSAELQDFRFQIPDSRFQVPDSRFQIPGSRFQVSDYTFQNQKPKAQNQKPNSHSAFRIPQSEVWRVKHSPPSRRVLRTVAGIALRATALYFRYGGLATSALGLARGGLSLAQAANTFRVSGLRSRFSSFDLTTLASNSARNYVSNQISLFGVASRTPNLLNRLNNLQIINSGNIRGRIAGNIIDRATPTRADVQESLLDRLDPTRQLDKLSEYFLRRKRLADLRGNYMYFYTDLPKPFDRKGLIGVNVHTGKDARFILTDEPDARFTIDEIVGLLYSADGNALRAFDVLNR